MCKTKEFHWFQSLLHRLYNKVERGQQPGPRAYVIKIEKSQIFFFGSNINILVFFLFFAQQNMGNNVVNLDFWSNFSFLCFPRKNTVGTMTVRVRVICFCFSRRNKDNKLLFDQPSKFLSWRNQFSLRRLNSRTEVGTISGSVKLLIASGSYIEFQT